MREELALQEYVLDEYEELDFERPRTRGRNSTRDDYEISEFSEKDYEVEENPDEKDFDRWINEYNRC